MENDKEIITSEELGEEFGDINAAKFFELGQTEDKDNKKKDQKKRNNNAT